MQKIEDNLRKNNDINMTEDESNLILQNILKFMDHYAPSILDEKFKNHKSPYLSQVFKIAGVVFASFFIFFVGGGVSYQASTALPGDLLYSLKVNTIEEVRGAFIKSTEEKLLYNQSRVAKRIEEVKTLAEAGELNTKKGAEIEKALDSHIQEIENAAKELKENNPESFKATAETITPLMEKHKNELKEVNDKSIIKPTSLQANNKEIKKDHDTKDSIQEPELYNMDKKEESTKAVDSIIAKIEKETDSIKAITEAEDIQTKSDFIENTKESEIQNKNFDKELFIDSKDATR